MENATLQKAEKHHENKCKVTIIQDLCDLCFTKRKRKRSYLRLLKFIFKFSHCHFLSYNFTTRYLTMNKRWLFFHNYLSKDLFTFFFSSVIIASSTIYRLHINNDLVFNKNKQVMCVCVWIVSYCFIIVKWSLPYIYITGVF